MEHEVVRAYVGVDWATEEHQVCVLDPAGAVIEERIFRHDGEGLRSLCEWLAGIGMGEPRSVRVGIEVPHGAVVEMLLERGFAVFSLNPKQMDRFRDRFTVAGAKDDRLDARVIADSLRTDGHCFRGLMLEQAELVELREWTRMAEELKEESTRLCNRMTQQLRRYYPQMLAIEIEVGSSCFLDLWERVPTPAAARRVRESSVSRLLKLHQIRKTTAAAVLMTLRQPALLVAAGTAEAAVHHIGQLVERLRMTKRQLRTCERAIDRLFKALADDDGEPTSGKKFEQRDVEILRSIPGVGRMVLAALLSEANWALAARDYHALRALCGVAPVTRNSGKRKGPRSLVVMRQACNHRLRGALYHWARTAVQWDVVTKTAYAELRRRGHAHGRALRGIGDRLLAMACAMLRDQTVYDPTRRRSASTIAA